MPATPADPNDPFDTPTPEALDQMAKGEGLFSEQWIAKTEAPVGVDLSQDPPIMRYQLLGDVLHTLQLFPSGAIARGVLEPIQAPFSLEAGEGWYDGEGKFLGDDPAIPAGE